LANGGYLSNLDEEWGKVSNPDLLTLEEISDAPCLVLLGEPGMGKSRELNKLQNLTEQKIFPEDQVLSLNLRSCTDLKDDLFKDEVFLDWLGNNYHLYLFLDSLDEGRLSVPTIATGLIDELQKKKYQNHLHCLHIRIACRTFVFSEISEVLETGLKELWQETEVGIYELVPLRRVDIALAAREEGFLSDKFLKEIDQKDVVPLAIKPITLGFLLNTYRKHNGQFPPDQKLYDLYLEGCKLLCEEVNPGRRASKQVGSLDTDQRLVVAARIAAVTIFTNRFAVWTGVDQGNLPIEDVSLQELCVGYETVQAREFEIDRKVIEEVLDTGLFSSRGLNRMGWAHQTYAEFLAAWYLFHHEVPMTKINTLILSSQEPDRKLIPQLHETAAWLASMRLDVLKEIIGTDPDVLLQTDVPTDAEVRAAIVDSLLIQYEQGKLFNSGRVNYRKYAKLKHPGLFEQLHPYICDSTKQLDARDLAIDIAETCEVSELQKELVNIALDSSQSIHLRVSAAKAISSIGNSEVRLQLKQLVIEDLPEDDGDRLKGYALQALWPDYLSAQELFSVLTPPRKRNHYGAYQAFVDYHLVEHLKPDDLLNALNWLERQGRRCFGYPFEKLADSIILKAWNNFNFPGVATAFVKAALVQWREHQKIITFDRKGKKEFNSSIPDNIERRRKLVEASVAIISESGDDPFYLCSSLTDNIVLSEDVYWMIGKLREPNCEKAQQIWSQLIQWNFDRRNVDHIDSIIEIYNSSKVFQKIFSSFLEPVELNSNRADKLKTDYLRMQEMKDNSQNIPLLDPPPKERVLQLLEKLEAGDLNAWWQLNMEMTLKPESQYYDNEFELDLTQLPMWQETDEAFQKRIIQGANKYIQHQNAVDYDWIGTNTFNRPAMAGYRALKLLLDKRPEFLETITTERWEKWTPAIVAVPNASQHEDSFLELAKYAYQNAPQTFTEILTSLIDKENEQHEYLFVINLLEKCWDEPLKLTLLSKATDAKLHPKCIGQLLEVLLKQDFAEAKDFAKSLISFPLPSNDKDRQKALIACRVLVENSDPSTWSFLWKFIQQNSTFGREVLELVAYRYSHGIQLNLTETQLADLYLWLVHQYPYDEDPDHSNEAMAYSVTARDGIARLRDSALAQLKELGTLQACFEIDRLVKELPEIEWLRKTLINARANMHRKTWQPLTQKEFLQFVIAQEPSNSEVVERITKKMEDEPKIRNEINISNSPNSPINAPIGTSGVTNNQVTTTSDAVSDTEKRINWGIWLAVIGLVVSIAGIPVGMAVSGAFNDEFKEWLNRVFSTEVEQQPVQKHQ